MNLITIEEKTSYGEFKHVYVADDLTINTVGLQVILKFHDVNMKRSITKVISLVSDKFTIKAI